MRCRLNDFLIPLHLFISKAIDILPPIFRQEACCVMEAILCVGFFYIYLYLAIWQHIGVEPQFLYLHQSAKRDTSQRITSFLIAAYHICPCITTRLLALCQYTDWDILVKPAPDQILLCNTKRKILESLFFPQRSFERRKRMVNSMFRLTHD